MGSKFALLGMVSVVTLLGGFGSTAEAQVVDLTNVQYTAANGDIKAKCEPKGTMNVPAGKAQYRVFCDYGTLSNGQFVKDATISAGGPSPTAFPGMGGDIQWTVSDPHELNSVPAGLYCRARLQKKNGTDWEDIAGAVDYATVP